MCFCDVRTAGYVILYFCLGAWYLLQTMGRYYLVALVTHYGFCFFFFFFNRYSCVSLLCPVLSFVITILSFLFTLFGRNLGLFHVFLFCFFFFFFCSVPYFVPRLFFCNVHGFKSRRSFPTFLHY